MAALPKYFKVSSDDGITVKLEPVYEELAPVRHGRWIHVEDDEYLCSACKMDFTIEDFDSVVTNYCPNCGAKMDGGKDNDCE